MPGDPAAALRSGKPEQVGTDLGTVLAQALKRHDLSDFEVEEVAQALQQPTDGSGEWAWVELNYRPHAYQTAADRWFAITSVDSPWFRPLPQTLA
jgi:hypothetical protein